MAEVKWHRFSEEVPQKEDRYLVCDNHGRINIKNWFSKFAYSRETIPAHFGKTSGRHSEAAANVYFWASLPEVPEELKGRVLKEEAIERQIAKLEKQLAELRSE